MLAVIIMSLAECIIALVDLRSVVDALKNCISAEVEIEADTEDILYRGCCRSVKSI